jgi:hypothetical protein
MSVSVASNVIVDKEYGNKSLKTIWKFGIWLLVKT